MKVTKLLKTLSDTLTKIDSVLSHDQLPNRWDVQTALKLTKDLLDIETVRRTGEDLSNITKEGQLKPGSRVYVEDGMYESDDLGNKINENQIEISLPSGKLVDTENASGPGKYKMYTTDKLMLTTDETGVLYPTAFFPYIEWEPFIVCYDGQWDGNGKQFRSESMLSMDKEQLLDIAEAAIIYTNNRHHIYLEGLKLESTDDGVHYLQLQFGS